MRCCLLCILLALGAGCASKPPASKINLTGFPPAFRDGYNDGCVSAQAGPPRRRDEARFTKDSQYAAGWRDGYDICRRPKDQ